jgi:hypothetical protein
LIVYIISFSTLQLAEVVSQFVDSLTRCAHEVGMALMYGSLMSCLFELFVCFLVFCAAPHVPINRWDAEFVDVEQELLFELILAAN